MADLPARTRAGAVPLTPAVQEALTFQSYGARPAVEGVRVVPLRRHQAPNGWFAEVARLEGGVAEPVEEIRMEVRQVSLSHADPDRINAFHIHPKVPQHELWTVVQGKLTIWLVDCRAGSATEGVRQRVILSGEEPRLLYIPAGVAHGYRAGAEGALLLYLMNQQFNAGDPNEGRLPWDHFGADLWAEDRG